MDSTTRSLRVTCTTQTHVPLDELHGIQGKLKEMSVESYEKFRRLVLRDGINFAMHVWKELDGTKKKGGVVKWWIIDGHGRAQLLRKLREEGYEVPPIPVVEIEAVSYKDAKRKVLSASSSFNHVTKDGLYEFMSDTELGMDDLHEYDIPDIDLQEFATEYFDGVSETEMPDLPSGEKAPFQQMTFTLHDEQAEQVKAALEAAKEMGPFDSPNENSNGNALARICETFLTSKR